MSNSETEANPRVGIGGNEPPIWATLRGFAGEENFSETVTDYLNDEYKQFDKPFDDLLDEARAIAALKVLPDKETRDKVPPLIKRIRDLAGKFNAFHTKEKEPYLRGGQAVDQKFYGKIDRLLRRVRTNKPGAADVLNAMLTDYDNAVLAAEQERRRLAAVEAARIAKAAQDKADAERIAAEEAAAAAERARKPETKEEKLDVAQAAAQTSAAANVEATVATARAEEAHIETLAKPADLMRERGDDGTMSTMAQEKYAEITDREKLDIAKLAPFLDYAALEKALRAWARTTDYRQAMPGASVGRRNKSRVL